MSTIFLKENKIEITTSFAAVDKRESKNKLLAWRYSGDGMARARVGGEQGRASRVCDLGRPANGSAPLEPLANEERARASLSAVIDCVVVCDASRCDAFHQHSTLYNSESNQ